MKKADRSVIEYWEKRSIPEPNTGCWLWTGPVAQDGYGKISFYSEGKKHHAPAHRFLWISLFGMPGKSIKVCHRCDNKICINPDHLFLGTQLDNMRDKVSKNRQCKGDASPFAVLTTEQVLEIKRRYASGLQKGDHKRMVKEFGVSDVTITKIGTGIGWRHLNATYTLPSEPTDEHYDIGG